MLTIQGLTAQPENIPGLVREQISRILVPVVAICKLCPYSVYPAITIRMEQPAGKSAGIFRDNDALPCLQLDFPHVLAARAVLREKARPMPRTTDNFRAADLLLIRTLLPGRTALMARSHSRRSPGQASAHTMRSFQTSLSLVLARLMQPSPR
jgi:hypothetical protein